MWTVLHGACCNCSNEAGGPGRALESVEGVQEEMFMFLRERERERERERYTLFISIFVFGS